MPREPLTTSATPSRAAASQRGDEAAVESARREQPSSPLAQSPLTTMLPVRDSERARRYYEEVLGLVPEGLRPDGKFIFRCGNGALLALFPKPDGTKAEHTAVSFQVADIGAAIRALTARGVVFHDYDLPGFRTVEHVCVLGSEKAAWFSDPEGNILCIHEDLA